MQKKIILLAKIALISIVVTFLSILLVKRFVYYKPEKEMIAPKVEFEEADEGKVYAWVLEGTSGKAILFCHDSVGNISYYQDDVINLNKMGHTVLIFDYTGFGKSYGVPNEEKCYHNACVYADIMIGKYGKENIIVYGDRFGCAIASYIALRYRIPKLILNSPYPRLSDMLKKKFSIFKVFSIFFPEFDTESYLKKYTGKTFLIHTKDSLLEKNEIENLKENSTIFSEIFSEKEINNFIM